MGEDFVLSFPTPKGKVIWIAEEIHGASVLINLGEVQTDQGMFLTEPSMWLSLVFLKIPHIF